MSLYHPDHAPYKNFTKRSRFEKAVQTLTGVLRGITIDGKLNAAEVAETLNWCQEFSDLLGKSPFDELKSKLDNVLADGVIDPEEQEDLLWVCQNLAQDGDYFDAATQEIQQLHGIMHGVMADGVISEEEVRGIQQWVWDHSHLKGSYPFDELDSILTTILKDGKIDAEEQELLRVFFEDFVEFSTGKTFRDTGDSSRRGLTKKFALSGICAACPEITFNGRVFTLTGSSAKATRNQIVKRIESLGGQFSPSVTNATEYLVIGAAGNPCWTFSCYGRKVEQAVELRKRGKPIIIVHESDFWDSVADA